MVYEAAMAPRPGLSSWLPIALLAGMLGGCSSGDPTVEGANGTVDCRDVLEPGVLGDFGWPTDAWQSKVKAEDDQCIWSMSSIGTITAYVVDGSGSAQEMYDAACARVAELGPQDESLRTALAGGGTACVVGLDPAVQQGTAELVLLTPEDVVLDLRVEATALLDRERLLEGLRTLSRQAQTQLVR
jgi:hypothetical protein